MKIKKIELSDFISHQQSSIEFKGEVNVIIGPNGAGKSSIVDGIAFSLFRDSSRGSQEELIRIGSNRAKVKLTLSNEKDTIYIERNISKGSSTIEDKIILNGKPLAFGARNVSNEIEKILGIDKNVALSTIIVRQGELDLILDNFHDIISNILKLDSIRKLVDSRGPLLNYKKELESKLKQLELINQYRIEREKDLKVKKERISQLQQIIEKLLKEIEKLREEYNRCEDQFEEYDKIRLQFTQISSELKEKKSRYNKLQEEIEKLYKETKDLDDLEVQVLELDKLKEVQNKIKEYELYKKNLSDKNRNISELEREINEYKMKLKRKNELVSYYNDYITLQKEKKEIEEKYRNYRDLKKELELVLSSISKKRDELRRLENIVNLQQITELERKMNELEAKRSSLDQELGEVNSTIKENENIVSNINEVKTDRCPICGRPLDFEHKKKILDEANEKIKQAKDRKEILLVELKKITNELNIAKNSYDKYKQYRVRYENLVKDLEEDESKKKEIESRIKEYGNIEDEIQKIESKLKDLEEPYKEYLGLSRYNEKELEDKIKRLERENTEREELKKEIARLENELKGLDKELVENKVRELEEKKKILEEKKRKKSILEKDLQDLSNLEKEIKELEDKIIGIKFDEKEYNELKNKKESLLKEIQYKENEKSRLEGELNTLKSDIEKLENEIENYKLQLKDKDKIENGIKKIEKIREALGEKRLQRYIIMTVKQIIENNLNDIISKFDLSIKNVEIDISPTKSKSSKSDIIVYTNSGDKLLVPSLSGGEKIALALALRLAIAKSLMSNTNFFVLDEPTIHLDAQRRQYLIDLIRSLKDAVPQIIIVTHDEEVLSAGDYVIRVEKSGNKSLVREEI